MAADTAAHGVLEDEALELMEKVDRTQSTLRECEEKLRRAEEEARRFTADFESVAGGLRERAAALTAQVRQAESGLTGDVAEKYRRLVEAYGAGALASFESGVCSNCQMQVTPQYRVLLNSGKVMFCGSCGRLMYVPPNAA